MRVPTVIPLIPLPAIGLLGACGSDSGLTQLCGHQEEGFDIEEASVLEDGQGYPGMHDAVVLEWDQLDTLPADATWRVKSVDIMPMIPTADFSAFQDGQGVSVEIWDADSPDAQPFTVMQQFDKAALEWHQTHLDDPYTAAPNESFAWWTFDFTDTIPTSGLTGPEYLVGVAWGGSGSPPMGYSNFNRPCELNWTDYADGRGWVLNGQTAGDECSWPMLRVEIEVLQEQAVCDEDSVQIE